MHKNKQIALALNVQPKTCFTKTNRQYSKWPNFAKDKVACLDAWPKLFCQHDGIYWLLRPTNDPQDGKEWLTIDRNRKVCWHSTFCAAWVFMAESLLDLTK